MKKYACFLRRGRYFNYRKSFVVLSGKQTSTEGYLGYYDDQVTVLEEGDQYEMFGWLLPLAPRPTISGTFPNGLYPDLKFQANTNTHGEKRAFVVTGQYESVLPMDIYPQHLMKAIITNDFERMEASLKYVLCWRTRLVPRLLHARPRSWRAEWPRIETAPSS